MAVRLFIGIVLLAVYVYNSREQLLPNKTDWTGVVRQRNSHSCGYASLEMVFEYHHIQKKLYGNSKSLSMQSLLAYSHANGLNAKGFRCSIKDLRIVKQPAILHFDNHFVVFDSIHNSTSYIRDPLRGRLLVDTLQLLNEWDGNAIFFDKF